MAKVSRSLATLDFVTKTNVEGKLSHLTVSALGGLLQSLVDATPARIGQTCLRGLYNDVHHTCPLTGKICDALRSNSAQARWQTWVGGMNFFNSTWEIPVDPALLGT